MIDLGGISASRSVSISAKFGVVVFVASIFASQGGRSAKFGIAVFKSSMLS